MDGLEEQMFDLTELPQNEMEIIKVGKKLNLNIFDNFLS